MKYGYMELKGRSTAKIVTKFYNRGSERYREMIVTSCCILFLYLEAVSHRHKSDTLHNLTV